MRIIAVTAPFAKLARTVRSVRAAKARPVKARPAKNVNLANHNAIAIAIALVMTAAEEKGEGGKSWLIRIHNLTALKSSAVTWKNWQTFCKAWPPVKN